MSYKEIMIVNRKLEQENKELREALDVIYNQITEDDKERMSTNLSLALGRGLAKYKQDKGEWYE